MATKKTNLVKPKSATKKKVVKKTVVAKKKTAKEIIESVKRKSTIAKDKAGTENNNKKNIYYSVKESIDKLVDALKYVVRYNS